ncbi:MAG: bifunctional metallophosphatase/5'-nucleotidase, partial [Leucobacter sp.]|nr:bifunctional metallophosphatase/5'-nucleotidase [Leucobacter sp.]
MYAQVWQNGQMFVSGYRPDPRRARAARNGRRTRKGVSGLAILVLGGVAPLLPAQALIPAQADPGPARTTVQVLTVNDFHGRIEADPLRSPGIAGAAVVSGAVAELRADHPATIFASAGDNVGASTFTSFIADDVPTIDALAQAGLDISAVGNHEFDRGITDLTHRILPRFGERTGTNGRQYGLGANVRDEVSGDPLLDEYAIVERDGVKIGFIGTVTEQTATSVNPGLIAGVQFTAQLDAANRVAAEIDGLVDATVLLTHDGARTDNCEAIAAEQSVFGALTREASPLIDAIVSAHTHHAYSCVIADRPVIQAGYYGAALGKLLFEFDTTSEAAVLTEVSAELVRLTNPETGELLFNADATVETIVAAAVAEADVRGREPVGRISADILRGGMPPGSDRSVESSLGNLIADITQHSIAGADIGVMNAGGLREDLIFYEDSADGLGGVHESGMVTYRDVANVQPFANTMMTVRLTGEQIKRMLAQQWTVGSQGEQKRHLSVSEALSYTYLPDAPLGSRITSVTLNGAPIDPTASYT